MLPIDSVKDRIDFWHTDVTFMSRRRRGRCSTRSTLPEVGGDTMWTSTPAPRTTRSRGRCSEFCDELIAIHYDPHYAEVIADGGGKDWEGQPARAVVAGRASRRARASGDRTPQPVRESAVHRRVEGLPRAQGNALFRLLYDHMTRPEFTCATAGSRGTLAFWDNRATMHYGVYDYEGARRVMHRVTLRGDRPCGTAPKIRRPTDSAPVSTRSGRK